MIQIVALNFIHAHWHAWTSNGEILLSNEQTKELFAFHKIDDCINYLWQLDQKETARALNKAAEGV